MKELPFLFPITAHFLIQENNTKGENPMKTRQQVAAFFHVTRMTIHRWERIYQLPRYCERKHYRIKNMDGDDLNEWFKEMRKREREAILAQRSIL